jgi:uncharacterized protein (UPF0261 family)
VGVIDYTTNEINDPLVGGIHDGGPDRLRRVGRLGLPQVLVPGCIDFSVWAAGSIPAALNGRPVYDHNPEYTLVLASHEEKSLMGRIFGERVSESIGDVRVVMPTRGLSIPAVPDGPFWDPEGDELFLQELRRHLRPDIPIEIVDLHINDAKLGRYVAGLFLTMTSKEQP